MDIKKINPTHFLVGSFIAVSIFTFGVFFFLSQYMDRISFMPLIPALGRQRQPNF